MLKLLFNSENWVVVSLVSCFTVLKIDLLVCLSLCDELIVLCFVFPSLELLKRFLLHSFWEQRSSFDCQEMFVCFLTFVLQLCSRGVSGNCETVRFSVWFPVENGSVFDATRNLCHVSADCKTIVLHIFVSDRPRIPSPKNKQVWFRLPSDVVNGIIWSCAFGGVHWWKWRRCD